MLGSCFLRVPNRRKWVVTAVALSLFSISSVHAYVPPATFIVKTWVNKHRGIKSLKIKSVVTAFEKGKPTSVHFKETTLFSPETLLLKSVATSDSEERLFQSEKKLNHVPLLTKLLLSSDLSDLTQSLRERGILVLPDESSATTSAKNVGLTRLNGNAAWVVGASGDSQLWFEKDTFLPLRQNYLDPSDKEVYDIRLESFRFSREFPYPRMITVMKKNSEVIFNIQMTEIVVNGEGPGLKSHSGAPESAFTSAGNSSPSAIKDLIQQYYGLIR